MKTKTCPICHTDYPADLPSCPHCNKSKLGGAKINKRTTGKKYEFGSYDRDLKHYYQQKRMIQIIAIIALCLALALVAWCLIAC